MTEHSLLDATRFTRPAMLMLILSYCLVGDASAQDQGLSIEGCIGCHALGEPAQVGNIDHVIDLHHL